MIAIENKETNGFDRFGPPQSGAKGPPRKEFEQNLSRQIVRQEQAIRPMSGIYQIVNDTTESEVRIMKRRRAIKKTLIRYRRLSLTATRSREKTLVKEAS